MGDFEVVDTKYMNKIKNKIKEICKTCCSDMWSFDEIDKMTIEQQLDRIELCYSIVQTTLKLTENILHNK